MRKIFSLFTAILFAGSMMAAVVSGTAYDVKTAASVPEGWTANGDYSTSGGGFFKITESTSYLQTDEFCQNGISSIVIKARKFGTVTGGKEVLTIEWIETGSDTPVELGTVSPTSTSLNNCQLSNPASIAGNKSGVIKIYSKNASSGGGAGVQTVTITYTSGTCAAIEPHTVSFSTGAGNPAVEAIAETEGGAGITLPAGPAPTCTNWAFAGWATTAVAAETTTAPTLLAAGATYKPAEDVTLYAVYKRTEESGEIGFVRYEKVTEDPEDWSGIYLLAANTSGDIYYTFTGQNGTNSYGASENHTPGTTEKTDWEVTVAKTTNGYSIYHTSSGKYLGLTGSGNNLNFNASFSANNYEWILSAANGAQSYAYNTRFIECNTSSSYRVACYTSSQKRFYLYKRIEDAIATYYYISAPTCEPVVEPTTKTIYCKVAQDWWKDGNAAVGVYAFKGEEKNAEFPGVRMTAVEGEADLWKADIDTAAYSSIIFTRFNPNDCNTEDCLNWGAQTEDLEIPADKDLYTITSATAQWIGEGNKVTGAWSVYGEEPVVVEPAKFYITGDSALVVNAGLDKEQAWNPAAIKSDAVSYKLNLAAGDYMLKITLNGTWDEGKVKGFDALTTVADGLTKGEGEAYDNICFTLAEAGEVSVHYDGEFFFLNGDFYVAPVEVHYYFKNNWGGEEWTWKEITNEEGYYMLGPVAVGGEGVNFHTAMTDDAPFITWAEISAFDASYDPAVIGAGDTVLFFFDPEEVNTYTGANGLSAQITYKYVAPEEPAKFYITGDSALVVNAGLDKEQAWNPAAIKSEVVSYKLNLAAGDYMLKITLDGTWNEGKVLGYNALTTVADGLTRGEGQANDNICFTLAEAGEVSVHYDGEFFFLNGDFYVAPVEVHYYFKNNWGGEEWTWKEITNEEGYYMLGPVAVGGEGVNFHTAMTDDAPFITWAEISAFDASYDPAVIGAGDTVLFFFDPEEVNTYTGANGLSAQITYKYVAPVYRLENGYYLLGSAQEWNVANLDAEDKFAANLNSDVEEYVLTATLAENQVFKVVYVENDAIKTYYPEGENNDYEVDAAHAGVKDIYFRPNYNGYEDWHNNCIYVAPNSGTAIDKVAGEAKAVKILKNGMLIIEKNGVKYNVLGVRL